MPLPETGRLTLSDIATEFGGDPPHLLSEYTQATQISGFYGLSAGPLPLLSVEKLIRPPSLIEALYFGLDLALSGDGSTLAVTTSNESGRAGACYIYSLAGNTWAFQTKVTASDASSNLRFGDGGVVLSSDGNTLAVSAQYVNKVYVFTRISDVWSEQQILTSTDSVSLDYYSCSLALSSDGNTLLVGAERHHTDGTSDAGAAYVFTRSGSVWTQQQKLQASNAGSGDYFGFALALSGDGDTALISAYREDTGATNAGMVYAFTRSGSVWTQVQQIAGSTSYDYLGYSMAMAPDGMTVVFGNNRDRAAKVYVFSNNTWTFQADLIVPDGFDDGDFGLSVAISGDGNTILVGSPGYDDPSQDVVGAIFAYTRTGNIWSSINDAPIVPSHLEEITDFARKGLALSYDGTQAFIAAAFKDTVTNNEDAVGAVYFYHS